MESDLRNREFSPGRKTAIVDEMTNDTVTLLDASRVSRLKTPYATRRVPAAAMATLLARSTMPKAGDLVLCRVKKLGQHCHLELASGRRARLFPGDEIVLAYGNRYALGWYFATLSQVSVVYGSLTTAIVVLLSLEMAATLLLLGAQVIAEYERIGLGGPKEPVPMRTEAA